MSRSTLNTALAMVLGFAAIGAQAAVLNNGDQLTINSFAYDSNGNPIYTSGGSYFAMDYTGDSKISNSEKNPLSMGYAGITIGQPTALGASHGGYMTAGDSNAIDAPWSFLGNTGSHYTTVGITGSTTAGLNMSGWTVTWNGIAVIPMGTGAWVTATGSGHNGATGIFTSGVGNLTWNGVYGTAYTLDYRATVPLNDPSGFGGVKYELHLEGIAGLVVPEVPVPAAAWLFGSGLMGLLGVGRCKAK